MLPRTEPEFVPRPKYIGPVVMVVGPGYVLSPPSQSEPAPVTFVSAPLPPIAPRTVSAEPPTLNVAVPLVIVIAPSIVLSPLLLRTIAPPDRTWFLFHTT